MLGVGAGGWVIIVVVYAGMVVVFGEAVAKAWTRLLGWMGWLVRDKGFFGGLGLIGGARDMG